MTSLDAYASVASVALSHGINANLVRKWLPLNRDKTPSKLAAFFPLKLEPIGAASTGISVHIGVPGEHATVVVKWPASDPQGCA